MSLSNDYFWEEDESEIPNQAGDEPLAIREKISDTSNTPTDSSTLIDRILSERQAMLKATLVDIISSVQERKSLLKEAISGIEKRECEIVSMIRHLDPFICYSIKVDYRRIALEKELTNLKKQKGEHNVQSWRDVVMLKKDLREFWQEYVIMRRGNLLEVSLNGNCKDESENL